MSCRNSTSNVSKNADSSPYKNYIEEMNKNVSGLNPERKSQRDKWIMELRDNTIYKDLVDSLSVSQNYLPVLSAVSQAIKNSYSVEGASQFGISEEIALDIENSENGAQKMSFVIAVSSLSMQMNGGLPKEIVEVFDRYRKKYNLYGEANINVFDSAGKKTKIEKPYNLSYAFGLFDSKDKKVLDAIYESTEAGISEWNEKGEESYENSFMALKRDYMQHLKKVYSDSPYLLDVDFEVTSSELYEAYEANEVAADEKYKGKKLAITGIIGNIGKDVLDNPYIAFKENHLQGVTCYFSDVNNKVISQLSKGQDVTVVGKCGGLTLTNVVIKDCKLY